MASRIIRCRAGSRSWSEVATPGPMPVPSTAPGGGVPVTVPSRRSGATGEHCGAVRARPVRPAGHPGAQPSARRDRRPDRRAYFRSWWVLDQHTDVAVVENFNWEAWVRRLNAGRRLAPCGRPTRTTCCSSSRRKRTYVWTDGRREWARSWTPWWPAERAYQAPGAMLGCWSRAGALGPSSPDPEGDVAAEIHCIALTLSHVDLLVNGDVARTIPVRASRPVRHRSAFACHMVPEANPHAGGGCSRRIRSGQRCRRQGMGTIPLAAGWWPSPAPPFIGDWTDRRPAAWR
jgi:hypothetical protein